MSRFLNTGTIIMAFLMLLAPGCRKQGPVPATTFMKTLGGSMSDVAYAVRQTADGGYIITGYTYSEITRSQDIWLVKMDAAGDTTWTRTFGDSYFNLGRSVQQTTDGGYIVAGITGYSDTGPRSIMLYKTDAAGNTLWERYFDGYIFDMDHSVQQTSDDGYIITGYVPEFITGIDDIALIKTDALGDTLWTTTIGGINTDQGYSIQQTSDGGYIIAGWTITNDTTWTDVLLLKTNASGDSLWSRTFGGEGGEAGLSVQQTSDQGYIIVGGTNSYGAGDMDIWLIKTDAAGDTIWTKTFGGKGYDVGNSIWQTTDGGYIITGRNGRTGPGEADLWIIKTDALGETVWTRTYGGPYEDIGWSVQQTSDGGYIVAGHTRSFGSGFLDMWIIKTDEEGNRRAL